MNVSLKTFVPAVAAGLLTLSSCGNSDVRKRAEKYMADKPRVEYEAIIEKYPDFYIQSKLDSVAYRDIFEGTEAAKDSALVEEFNKIAVSMRGYERTEHFCNIRGCVLKSAAKSGITTKEYQELKNKSVAYDGNLLRAEITQHYADDWAYRKFFEKAGIMNDSIAKKCDEVSVQIRP